MVNTGTRKKPTKAPYNKKGVGGGGHQHQHQKKLLSSGGFQSMGICSLYDAKISFLPLYSNPKPSKRFQLANPQEHRQQWLQAANAHPAQGHARDSARP